MAKKRKPSKRTASKKKPSKSKRAPRKRPAHKSQSKRQKSPTSSKPPSKKEIRVAAAGVALLGGAAQQVTMTIDFGAGAPGDILSVKRIDGQALSGSTVPVGSGSHTAGWDVISPTVRPIAFAVTVKDSAGKKLVDRPNEKTGADGKGAGADSFRV